MAIALIDMINVACVYYGNKYKIEYVQKLYSMVKRHLTYPFKFYCFTDHVKIHKILKEDIIFRRFTEQDLQGWWNKLQLFHPSTPLEGTTLYLDLDVVIMKRIDEFVEYGDKNEFCIIRDFGQPKAVYNSSIMRFNPQVHSNIIWDNWCKSKPSLKRLAGDQNVITTIFQREEYKGKVNNFPDEWTQSYKWTHRSDPLTQPSRRTYELLPNSKIVVFHGSPNPHESTQEWVINNWK